MSLERRVSSLITLLIVSLLVWVTFMVLVEVSPEYPEIEDLIRSGSPFPWQHYVVYGNAGLLTLLTAAVFAGMCAIYAEDFPLTCTVASVFIPVYAFGNLLVYLSQVLFLPAFSSSAPDPWIYQFVQTSNGSLIQFVNSLSYAVLGIPSVLIGRVLVRDPVGSSVGGTLLIISGILSWIALSGMASGNVILTLMSVVSGGVFLISLIVIVARMSKA